jgi:hypothetical protein
MFVTVSDERLAAVEDAASASDDQPMPAINVRSWSV